MWKCPNDSKMALKMMIKYVKGNLWHQLNANIILNFNNVNHFEVKEDHIQTK